MYLILDQLPNQDPVLTPKPVLTQDTVLVLSLTVNPDPNDMVLNPYPAVSVNGSTSRKAFESGSDSKSGYEIRLHEISAAFSPAAVSSNSLILTISSLIISSLTLIVHLLRGHHLKRAEKLINYSQSS
jgi:hypothetical protein